jgi:hypothetical protein
MNALPAYIWYMNVVFDMMSYAIPSAPDLHWVYYKLMSLY